MAQTEGEFKDRNPYLGPRPFAQNDASRFFGRDCEIADLCSLVAAHRTVLLYSQSGAGKSSLLNAGIAPNLKGRGFDVLPAARVSSSIEETIPPNVNIYVHNALRFWGDERVLAERSLAGGLAFRPRHTKASGNVLPRVVVFDQLEELFTNYPERWRQRREFFEQLAKAMEDEGTLRVLFVMREDFVGHLDPYEDILPEEFRTRYRLEQLREDAARDAISKPLEGTSIQFAPGVTDDLVSDLLSVRSREGDGESAQGEFVDPVQLQVTCFSLFRKLPSNATKITTDHRIAFGKVDHALREFYQDSLQETSLRAGVEEDSLRQWFESKLITESTGRGLVLRGEKETGGMPNPAVDVLEELHIIRPEARGRDRWYELSHDRFIVPILRANDEWRTRIRKKAAEQALQEAAFEAAKQEREAAQKRELAQTQALAIEQKLRADDAIAAARRLRRVLIYLVVVIVLGLGASLVAFVQQRRAHRNEQLVREKEAEAAHSSLLVQEKEAEATRNALLAQLNAQYKQNAIDTLKKVTEPIGNPPAVVSTGSRIKHIIVLMMENRSFDHMLGALKARDPRIDGLTGSENNVDETYAIVAVKGLATFQGQLNPDPAHSFSAVDLQIFGGQTSDNRVASMNGFIKSYYAQVNDVSRSHAVMYYFTLDKLPALATLATEFAVCDHWFSSIPGPSAPNRAFAHYGTSFGHVDLGALSNPLPYKSIFERMASKGRTSKVYYFDTSSTSPDALLLRSNAPQFFGTFASFLADTASGLLPEYSFIEPSFNDHDYDNGPIIATDQHPDHNVQAGDLFIATVYNAIRESSIWESSVLVITYSNHGGLFDHVPPPNAIRDGFEASADQTGTGKKFSFNRYGVRVPAVIISPYIPKGTVDHTVYDHASIPATVSKLFLKGPQQKSPRERGAHTFDHLLTITSPRTDAPTFNVN